MTLADHLTHNGLVLIPVTVQPGVKRWILCKDPSLVGTREAYCSARIFCRQTDVMWQLGMYPRRERNPTPWKPQRGRYREIGVSIGHGL